MPTRIGFVPLRYLGPIDAKMVAGYLGRVAALRARGHELIAVDLALDALAYQRRNGTIVAHEIHGRLGDLAKDGTRPLDPYVRQRILAGADIFKADHAALLAQCAVAIRQVQERMTDLPLILIPTKPIQACPVEEADEATIP